MSSESDDTLSADESERVDIGALPAGHLFAGRYEIERMIGRGGMGVVYRVRDRQLDEVVALKLLTLTEKRSVERFQREVRLARRVTHPNVARTHDIGSHEGIHFLTMEYVEGKPLDEIVGEGATLDPAKVAKIGEQIASGLESAHAAGVVHRDLKPANVLIGSDGRVVLTDFGIARATRADTRTHETGAVVGTPYYMAPEQVKGADVDGRTDIYALGLIMYELATGNFPFDADTPLAVAVVRLHAQPLDPRTFAAIPDALADVILRCIARDPDARFPDAGALREALVPLKGGVTTPPRPAHESSVSSGIGSLYAPISPGRRALAILPFVYRGTAEHDYLGEGLAEELIDTLSRTKGLRVLALGATKRFAEHRDPARIGMELSADFVVDGTVQLAQERVRIAARLVDTDSGVQRWSERFDGPFEDVFTLQEKMGQRVAESLRLEVDAAAHRRTAPQEAIELYLRARKFMRSDALMQAEDAVEMFEKCLELAPTFTPALPARAMASLRAWWSNQEKRGAERGTRAREHVAIAERDAPEMAETHFARAMLANQDGLYREAAQALAKTLEIAPTMPEAHWYLGEIQLESGRFKEGKKRIQLVLELDPTMHRAYLPLARIAAFDGDFALADEYLRKLEEMARGLATMPILAGRVRYAMWNKDVAKMRGFVDILARVDGEGPRAFHQLLLVGLGEQPAETVRPMLAMIPGWLGNKRFTSLIQQIAIEVLAFAGANEIALEVLEQAAEGILTDVEWIRRCPALEPLRGSAVFTKVAAKIEARAASTWQR